MRSQLFGVQSIVIIKNYLFGNFRRFFFSLVFSLMLTNGTLNIKAQNAAPQTIQNEQKSSESKKDEGTTLNLCWKTTSDANSSALMPTLSANQVLIPLENGDLKALNAFDGGQLWVSTLGGEIVASPLITEKIVVVVNKVRDSQTDAQITKDSSKSQISETTTSAKAKVNSGESVKIADSIFIVRGLSAATGLTLWQREFAGGNVSIAFNKNKTDSKIFVALGGLNNTSNIVALNEKTGANEWSKSLPSDFVIPIIAESDSVYVTTKDGFLHLLNGSDGAETVRFKLDNFAPTRFAAIQHNWILGDAAGNVVAVDVSSRKVLWKLRTGGATQNFLPVRNGVLIASLDNFVYFQSFPKGKRLWRRRLAARPIGGLVFSDKFALLCASGEDSAIIINLPDGKIVGKAYFGVENYAVSAPTTNDKFIVVQTAKGLMSFAISQSDCQKTP